MIEDLKSKLNELIEKKQDLKPKLEEIEARRTDALAKINKKYDHMVADANIEVMQFEQKILNDLITLFSTTIMNEFDQKRSTSEYILTEKFKVYRDSFAEIEMFPKELIERMDKVINGSLIENIAYDLDKIERTYKK
jgi:predicted Zn-dependent protease with MMP-like domain